MQIIFYYTRQQCDHDGGNLFTVDSSVEEGIIHDFSKNTKKNYWFGLRSYPQVSTLFLLKCLCQVRKVLGHAYVH